MPLCGSMELTHRCNMKCVHCYLGEQSIHWSASEGELKTEQALSIIDEVVEAGCLFFLITGGEPLLRKDFPEIYRHARSRGLLVTVFTNGTLISDSILDLFGDLPPQTVEISLYGASSETYETITRTKGSFGRCLAGIEGLLKRNINVRLKTILMTLNSHEFFEIKKMAVDYGVKFRFDASITPCLDGNRSPLMFRVPPEVSVDNEFSDKNMIQSWRDYLEKYRDYTDPDTLFNCNAGIISFHIDPYGNLKPCLMTKEPSYYLPSGNFSAGWRDVMPRIREIKVGIDYLCNRCERRDLCNFCPVGFKLENGGIDMHSEYHCAVSRLRNNMIRAKCGGESHAR